MFSIDLKYSGETLIMSLIGVIDETVDFKLYIKNAPDMIHVDCSAVRQINSIGTNIWKAYFAELRSKGVGLLFFGLPPALVDHLNFSSDFLDLEEVGSVYIPFWCATCKVEIVQDFKTNELVKYRGGKISFPCGTCSAQLQFDDKATDYLYFLDHGSAK